MAIKYSDRPITTKLSELAYEKFKNQKFAMLTTETGTGKTFVSIRTAWLLDPRTMLLVIDPKSKIIEAGWKKSLDSFNEAKNSDLQLFELNYEQLTLKKGQEKIVEILNKAKEEQRPILLIFDELHYIKLSTSGTMSKRTKAAIELSNSSLVTRTLGITATPMPNSYLDGGTYFILGGFYKNKTQFIDEQVKYFNDYHAPIVKDAHNNVSRDFFNDPDKLDAIINQLTVNTTNTAGLPDVEKIRMNFELDNTNKIKIPDFIDLTGDETPMTHLQYYRKLKRMRGYFEQPSQFTAMARKIITHDNNRLQKLGWILYDEFYNSKDPAPILIFYQYNLEMKVVTKFIKENEFFKDVDIHYVNSMRKDVEEPENPKTVVLIQYRAGSAAIEFPTSHTSIFFMPTYSYQDFKQAKGRNVRDGGKHVVKQYELCATKTLDDLVWATLDNKKTFSKKMQDNFYNISI